MCDICGNPGHNNGNCCHCGSSKHVTNRCNLLELVDLMKIGIPPEHLFDVVIDLSEESLC